MRSTKWHFVPHGGISCLTRDDRCYATRHGSRDGAHKKQGLFLLIFSNAARQKAHQTRKRILTVVVLRASSLSRCNAPSNYACRYALACGRGRFFRLFSLPSRISKLTFSLVPFPFFLLSKVLVSAASETRASRSAELIKSLCDIERDWRSEGEMIASHKRNSRCKREMLENSQ